MTQLTKNAQHFLGLPSAILAFQPEIIIEEEPKKHTERKRAPYKKHTRTKRTFTNDVLKKVHKLKQKKLTYVEIFFQLEHEFKKQTNWRSMSHAYRDWLDANLE